MEKVIYVTGISGFIGRSLLSHLSHHFLQVINFTRRGTIQIFEQSEITELEASSEFLLQCPSTTLINLATLYEPYPKTKTDLDDLIEANILFPSRVINLMKGMGPLKVVNALSYHQLLDFSSQNVYSLSKELLKKFLDHQNIYNINLYIFDTFGKGDTRNKVIDVFIRNILAQKPIKIPANEIKINVSGSEAIACSIIHSLRLDAGSYALNSPDTLSLESLAEIIIGLTGVPVEIIKENIGNNYFASLPSLPKNIFMPPPGYNFMNRLQERIDEIKNET